MKAGDKVKCIDNQMLESVFNLDDTYIISYAHPDGLHISIENLGRAMYHADRFELIKEEDMQKKFNPKPGDKIICNNGEEFICCKLEFLQETIAKFIRSDKPILGYGSEFSEWQDWDEHGKASDYNDDDYNIREVIPQISEVPTDKKEEPRYNMQEIKEAWDASGWVTATSSWGAFQKNLTKINSAEYQEYLRLKAIYE